MSLNTDEEPKEEDNYTKRTARCCQLSISPYPVYAVSLLFYVPYGVNRTTLNSILYNKLCYLKYQNSTMCSNQTFTSNHPDLQEDQAAWMNYVDLAQIPLSILTNLMLSTYCDRVGHKLPLLLPTIGLALGSLVLAVLATPQWLGLPMAMSFIFSAVYSISGGNCMVTMAGLSYVASITSSTETSFYMSIFEGTLLLGVLIGNTLTAAIVNTLGLDIIAYVSSGLSLLPLFIAIFFVTDTKSMKTTSVELHERWRWSCSNVLGLDSLLAAFKTVLKKRKAYGRILLILTFVIYAGPLLCNLGFSSDAYLYFVKEKGMTVSDYSIFYAYHEAIKGLGGSVILYVVSRWWKVDYFHLMMVSTSCDIFGYILMSLPAIPGNIWIGATLLAGHTVMRAQVRALQALLCDKSELGKMFAFDAIFQVIVTNIVRIGFKSAYSATFQTWSELFFVLCALLLLSSMIFMVALAIVKDKQDSFILMPQ